MNPLIFLNATKHMVADMSIASASLKKLETVEDADLRCCIIYLVVRNLEEARSSLEIIARHFADAAQAEPPGDVDGIDGAAGSAEHE